MRGAYTCGVLDAFLDHDIEVDGLIGVSAGICHGCSYVSKQRGRAFRAQLPHSHYTRTHPLLQARLAMPERKATTGGY